MARPRADQPLIPSVLDRLLDEDPRVTSEPAKPRAQVLRELKQSVRRDLENLLNTRWSATTWPPHLEEIERSLVNYGIPDITGSDLGSAQEREDFRRIMERTILYFEPRFQSVTIKIVEHAEQLDRTLRFRIEGLLRVEPVPEPVAFDSVFEPATGDVEVKGSSQ